MTSEPPVATMTPPAPSPDPAPGGRPRRWIKVLGVIWALILVAGATYAAINGVATARDQTTVADAQPEVGRTIVMVASAVLADNQAVVAVSGFDRVGECAVTVFRSGERYQQVLTATVTPGTEEALMRRVADRLPASYGTVVHGGQIPRLAADAGFFIRLNGTVAAPGRVRFVADTGECRPLGDLVTAEGGLSAADATGRTAVEGVLSRLRVRPTQWAAHRVACPGGGTMSTVEVVAGDGDVPPSLQSTLGTDANPIVSTRDLYAFRSGSIGVAARADDKNIVVTATTTCQ